MRRVVVTGLGLVAPNGNTVEASWRNTVDAVSGIGEITLFEHQDLPVHLAAEVKKFDALLGMSAKDVGRTSRFVQLAAVAAAEALKDAGLEDKGEDRDRFGCSIGVGIGSLADMEENSLLLKEKGPRRISPFFLPFTIPNMAAGFVSMQHRLRGPNICTTTACTSGTHAVGEAWMLIRSGVADRMLAGGAESAICRLGIAAFANMKALSQDSAAGSAASRPFDLHRDGFVMGEGAGLLVLEEMEVARARGARILAEVIGYGMSADAHHITAPAPEGEGALRCMMMALQTAAIRGDQVDYINAHGTSTKLNDMFESMAISRLLGDHAHKVAISSTKGVTGHCLGGAGGLEAVYTVLALRDGIVPPTAHLETPDPDCPLDYTPRAARERKLRYALSNSFGFGGTNGCVAFSAA